MNYLTGCTTLAIVAVLLCFMVLNHMAVVGNRNLRKLLDQSHQQTASLLATLKKTTASLERSNAMVEDLIAEKSAAWGVHKERL